MTRTIAFAAIGLILLALAGLGLALALNRPSRPVKVPKTSRERFQPIDLQEPLVTKAPTA